MGIPRPLTTVAAPEHMGCELCLFPEDDADKWGARYFTFAGGICWPIPVARQGAMSVKGCAVIVGLDIDTKVYHVFEQREFVTLEHILGTGRSIAFEGITNWLNDAWSKYRCLRFWHHQDVETMDRYARQVWRCDQIDPKPWLADLASFDPTTALRIIWELLETRRLKHRKGEPVDIERQIAVAAGGKVLETAPALTALAVCLAGMEHHPWRKPVPE